MNPGVLKLRFILVFFFISLSLNAKPLEGFLAKIQILDKITAKVQTLTLEVNNSFQFESLNIEVFACFKKPPEEIPENFVLLKIYDSINKKEKKIIYQGWMISSSPATTPLEHPIYDIWLIDCKIENDF